MKKVPLIVSCLISVLLAGCKSVSSVDGVVNENVHPKMPEYVSSYVPVMTEQLPVVKINSESGSNDFISLPVDKDVSNAKKGWGGYKGEPEPWYEKCEITITDEKNKVTLDKVEAKVKVRGNWTSNYPKKPLRIQFDKKQSVLGLNGSVKMKDWVMLASYKDWSFLRDQTGYYLGHLVSPLYTTDFRLVELYVNEEYQGLYVIAEKQDVDKDRINITKCSKTELGTNIGYLLELDGHSHQDEPAFDLRYGHPLQDYNQKTVENFVERYTIKSNVNNKNQIYFIRDYMQDLWTLCYEAVYNRKYYKFSDDYFELVPSNARTCYECISNVVDLESLVNTYIMNEIVCDADFYMTSFFMNIDFGENGSKKLRFEAPWDFDSSLGNKNFCADAKGLFAGVSSWDVDHNKFGYGNPWFLIFVNCSWFQDMVRQKWAMIHEQDVIGKLVTLIDYESTTYEKYFIKNYDLWKNCGNAYTLGELCPGAARCKTEKQAAEYLKKWLITRFSSLDELWLE